VSEAPVSASFESLSNLPGPVRSIASEGVRRLIDYQDAGYAQRYLDIVQGMAGLDEKFAGQTQRWDLTIALARHLALCMAYEDTIRIADLKTRRSRFERLRGELRARPGQLLHFTEFMHPRVEEVADSLPPALGRRLLRNRFLRGILTRACSGGLRLRTTSLRGFLPLWLLGRLRGYRRRTLRFVREMAQIDAWLAHVERVVEKDYALACEMIECAQVLKGYGETAERGRRNFDALLEAADRLLGRDDAARGLRRLREAALQDEDGGAFAAARGMLAL
jgi:indolepyruvate ferredoxin oxidoreductase beta subunit